MKYGLIGKEIEHSYSPLIHELSCGIQYEICEKSLDEFDSFFKERKFKGINVTMPYKERVIRYLDCVDDSVMEINACNTIVNIDGLLYGYNTDYSGLLKAIERKEYNIEGKDVIILGSGGASKACKYACEFAGCKRVRICSRSENFDLTYKTVLGDKDVNVIINATPMGRAGYPEVDFDLTSFVNLECVVDLVYNPTNTLFIQNARSNNLVCVTGLDMLIYQALDADKLFGFKPRSFDKVKKQLESKIHNIIITGFMATGKSTIGQSLALKLNKGFIDTDELIEKAAGKSVEQIISEDGIDKFRQLEEEVLNSIDSDLNSVITLGGGAIIHKDALLNLKKNSVVVYIERDLDDAYNDAIKLNRPLAKSKEDFNLLFMERESLYKDYADILVYNKKISTTIKKIYKYFR